MNIPVFKNQLPLPVRQALVQAAQKGTPGSFERTREIDAVIKQAKQKHPQLFKPE